MEDRLIAERAADAFRARLGISRWEHVEDEGWGNHWPTTGHMFVFRATDESDELTRHGITSLRLNVIVPTSVHVSFEIEEMILLISLHTKKALVLVPLEPRGYEHRTWDKAEIDEMCSQYDPIRLVLEAIEDAEALLKSEAEALDDDVARKRASQKSPTSRMRKGR
jgi:hypothetical protein